MGKVIERVMVEQLQSHLDEKHDLDLFPSEFRACHVPQTALLTLHDGLLREGDKRSYAKLVLLDFSTAFDN